MNTLFKKNLIYIFFILNFFHMAYAETDNLIDRKIQAKINQDRIKYNLPALSVSIQFPDEAKQRNYVSGFYSLSNKKKITSNTLFEIGSITKTYTATMIMQLVEANKIKFDDTLAKWLPQYPRWSHITIKQLSLHTSGIYNFTSGADFDNDLRTKPHHIWTLNESADFAYQHPDPAKPGKKYRYSNTDYVLLGLIIEKATHQTIQKNFDEYLKHYHLNNTFYIGTGFPVAVLQRIAKGYNRDGTFADNQDVTFVSPSYGQSAGALLASPSDVNKWLTFLFANKIILRASLQQMMAILNEETAQPVRLQHMNTKNFSKEHFTEIGSGFGMGLIYFPHYGFVWAHSGGTPGYESFYTYNPCTGISVVLMYNVKPKQQLIFTDISSDLFSILTSTSRIQSDKSPSSYCSQIGK